MNIKTTNLLSGKSHLFPFFNTEDSVGVITILSDPMQLDGVAPLFG